MPHETAALPRGRFRRFDVFHLAGVNHSGERAPSRVFLRALAEKQGTFPDRGFVCDYGVGFTTMITQKSGILKPAMDVRLGTSLLL